MAVEEFSPLDAFLKIYRRLWWIILLSILGGGIGWGFHYLQPPVYEAKAVISVNIDLTLTGKLTQYEQDQIIGVAYALLASPNVLNEVLSQAQAQNLPINGLVYDQDFFLERRQAQLQIRYRNRDASVAAAVTNIWIDAALNELTKAHSHAVRARLLQQYMDAVKAYKISSQDCPAAPPLTPPVPEVCGNLTSGQYRQAFQEIEAQYNNEFYLSEALNDALRFSLTRKANIPAIPVAYRISLLVLMGALIGFVVGIFTVNMKLPEFKAKSRLAEKIS